MPSLRLYFDEDSLHLAVVQALRRMGLDCLTTEEAKRRRAGDSEQLLFATEQGRAVFTRNTGHFAALHATWLAEGRSHAGIIVLTDQTAPVGVIERAMRNLNSRFDAVSIRDQIVFLLNYTE